MKYKEYNIPILDKVIRLVLGTSKFIAFCIAGLFVLFLVWFVMKQRANQEMYKAPFHDVTIAGETFRLPSKYYPDDGRPEYKDSGFISFKLMTWDIDPNIPIKGKTVGLNLYDQVRVYIQESANPNVFQLPLKERSIFKGPPVLKPIKYVAEDKERIKGINYLGTLRTESYFFSEKNKKYFFCMTNHIGLNSICTVRFLLEPYTHLQVRIDVSRKHIENIPKIIDGVTHIIKNSAVKR